MKLALLKGDRYNPWHVAAFQHIPEVEPVVFRTESDFRRRIREVRGPLFPSETLPMDTHAGAPFQRFLNVVRARAGNREPRMAPFHNRLREFDLIQTWELFTDWSAEGLRAHQKWDIPLSVMVWDNIPFNMERDPGRRALKEAVARGASQFIVHTERSRRTLDIEGVAAERVVKLDPGVDTERFSPGPPNRKAFGLPDSSFVILFVGWLLPRKGIDFLLLALRELLRDTALADFDARLLVVGSGPGADRVERLVSRLDIGGACTFAGALPHDRMPEAFRSADVFVLPSVATPEWQEQFGMSLVEALACGVPVISTHTGAVAETVEDAAVLCQPNDFVSLYEALKELMRDSKARQALGERGRALALRRFQLGPYAAALSEIYLKLR